MKKSKQFLVLASAAILAVSLLGGCSGADSSKAPAATAGNGGGSYATAAETAAAGSPAEDGAPGAYEAAEGTYGRDSADSSDRAPAAGEYEAAAEPEPAANRSDDRTSQIPERPAPGILTAGEWCDNDNFAFLYGLMQNNREWEAFSDSWDMVLSRRTVVKVTDNQKPAKHVKVELLGSNETVIWSAVTDHTGTAYLFYGLGSEDGEEPASVRVTDGLLTQKRDYQPGHEFAFSLNEPKPETDGLDLMLVIDTTGSMGDELEFLKKELESVVDRVKQDNANIPVRLSVNVYRDVTDDYTVKSSPFMNDINKSVRFLREQSAGGGGDFEEAVEEALADAIYDHEWNPDAEAKLLFIVLDAPPHNTNKNREKMKELMADAAAKGIRIIPVASSGIDKNTEFLLRSLSVTTGGSYAFLTDHSGVGESHLEPTIGDYKVKLLNNLLVEIINRYLD